MIGLPNGYHQRHALVPIRLSQLIDYLVEIGVIAIQFVYEDSAGRLVLVGVEHCVVRAHLYAGRRVDHDDDVVEHGHGRRHLAQEVRIAGMVHHVDADAFPVHVREFHADGLLALDFLFEIIADRVAVLDPAQSVGLASGVKHVLDKRRLPRPAVT